ncbi:DUF3239 domain-containing protein [Nocardia seriolae]|uniref:Histidine kinase n=1 Tax=Nocardia seriolae TaxID=37332 RepID=A0A0B8MZ98_9NOCA|nr:DUF3239 domain-containing protein [Nocardia seriolae]APB01819.1 hypothetical protein NS506_07801 [Nocardia seriolae]MTJ60725.1 DUF3239 domain-containing protein [Nocardia seriolae]MTJ70336.1 DUF3239 domain-containing protein [Nocardia seriolae]MTJ91130.1 DUF3239 domain-containing protein [Nocardia seriolae]MTK35092.1 DUF3239 domain-containing protein [Nocardia seriolae]
MRRFEFAVDREHARAVNEVVADLRRLRIWAYTAAVALGLAVAVLVWVNHPWSWLLAVAFLLAAVTALFIGYWMPHRGRVDKLYAMGELVPAVVSETHGNGATLLALVDLAKPSAQGPRYALVTRTVRSLPGHRARAGERVPSVTVRVDRAPGPVGDLWQTVSAMPLAWGTRDLNIIERARTAINEVEWKLLTDNLDLADKVRGADAKRLLLDPQQLPDELRG